MVMIAKKTFRNFARYQNSGKSFPLSCFILRTCLRPERQFVLWVSSPVVDALIIIQGFLFLSGFQNHALEGIFPEICPLRIVLISFRVLPLRTFRINLLDEKDAVLSV